MNEPLDLIVPRRWRAPRGDGQVLIDPPLADEADWLRRNVARRQTYNCQLAGRSLVGLAAEARRELLATARQYTAAYREVPDEPRDPDAPVILVGHQPELVHPGVWFKNFVLSALAARTASHAVHVICDNDAARTPTVRVPTGSLARPLVASIPLDRPAPPMAYEQRPVYDHALFRTFAARVREAIAPLVPQPLVASWWPQAIDAMRATDRLGLALARARHQLEGQWGLTTLEVPLSALCHLPAYRRFAAHMLNSAHRFQQVHNDLLATYRRINGVRSHTHPVPSLATVDGWIETPFWLWTLRDPTRRPAYIRRGAQGLELTDRAGLRKHLAVDRGGALIDVEQQLAAWETAGLCLRPRALMTTLFCRLLLSDVFIHGIGGAKYDELTDAIARRFFGIELPSFLVVSLTAMLPIDFPQVTWDDVRRIDQLRRDLRFHPECHLRTKGDAQQLVRQKAALLAVIPPRGQRRDWHARLESINAALHTHLRAERQQLVTERARLLSAVRGERILHAREFAFCLFPAENLRARLLDLSRQEP